MEPAIEYPGLQTETLILERMSLISSPHHRLVEKTVVTLEDLADETMLQTEPGCTYRGVFEDHIEKNGIRLVSFVKIAQSHAQNWV